MRLTRHLVDSALSCWGRRTGGKSCSAGRQERVCCNSRDRIEEPAVREEKSEEESEEEREEKSEEERRKEKKRVRKREKKREE